MRFAGRPVDHDHKNDGKPTKRLKVATDEKSGKSQSLSLPVREDVDFRISGARDIDWFATLGKVVPPSSPLEIDSNTFRGQTKVATPIVKIEALFEAKRPNGINIISPDYLFWNLSHFSPKTAIQFLSALSALAVACYFGSQLFFLKPFCTDTDSAECSRCPPEGECRGGFLVSCKHGFEPWFSWAKGHGSCEPTFTSRIHSWSISISSAVWTCVSPWIIPLLTAVGTIGFLFWRWKRSLFHSARAFVWRKKAWEILNSTEEHEVIPIDMLKEKILRDEFGSMRAARRWEWLWCSEVEPELIQSSLLRVEPRMFHGEERTVLTVLSPKRLRGINLESNSCAPSATSADSSPPIPVRFAFGANQSERRPVLTSLASSTALPRTTPRETWWSWLNSEDKTDFVVPRLR